MFSIIVPTHNRASLLQECLNSIKDQDFSEYEVWIMDDCSIDNTEEIAKEFTKDPRFKYYRFNTNNGNPQKVLHYALSNNLCKYDYYIIICDDDTMPNKLSLKTANDLLRQNKDIKVILAEFPSRYGPIKLYNPNSANLPNVFYYNDICESVMSKIQFAVHKDLEQDFIYDTMHKDSVTEPSVESLCLNKWIGYDKNIEYCISFRADNRKKYESIYTYILSILENIYKGIINAKSAEKKIDFFKKISMECFCFKMMIFYSIPDEFSDEILEYMKNSLDDKKQFFIKAEEISKIAEKRYQNLIDNDILELNKRLLSYEEQNAIISKSKTFCIYGKTVNGESIKQQLEDKGLKFLYWLDDASNFGAKEFIKYKNKPDMIYIGACRPSFVSNMLKKLDEWDGPKLALFERG